MPNIFSFPKNSKKFDKFDEITTLFRDNTLGGSCMIYHKHITLMDEDVPYAALYNKNGKFLFEFVNLNLY